MAGRNGARKVHAMDAQGDDQGKDDVCEVNVSLILSKRVTEYAELNWELEVDLSGTPRSSALGVKRN